MHPDASEWMWTDVHNRLQKSKIASIVFTKHKNADTHLGICVFLLQGCGIRKINPSCRWQLGRRQLDGGETIIFAAGKNANESLILCQRITVILIQQNDGYFMFKTCLLKTFWEGNL